MSPLHLGGTGLQQLGLLDTRKDYDCIINSPWRTVLAAELLVMLTLHDLAVIRAFESGRAVGTGTFWSRVVGIAGEAVRRGLSWPLPRC